MTHAESPWQRADKSRRKDGSPNIEREWIKDYFIEAQRSDDDGPWPDSNAIRQFVQCAEQRRRRPVRPDSIDGLQVSTWHQGAEVDRFVTLGASPIDNDHGMVGTVMLADPDGNEFCVLAPEPQE